jgi:hypothetical protein
MPKPGPSAAKSSPHHSPEETAKANAERREHERAFVAARGEIFEMQTAYRKKNGQYCEDLRELLRAYEAEGKKAHASTVELIQNGSIAMDIVSGGVTVRGLRPPPQ